LQCADSGQSWPLRANTLSDMARLAMYLGSHDEALSLIEFAQVRQDRISATSRAMLGAVRAQALARLGRHKEAHAQVEIADGYFAERNVGEDPPWVSYYDEAEHQGSTARAMMPAAVRDKNVEPARARLEAAIRLHDQHHPRSRAFSGVRLASLLMQAGDPHEAAAVGREVVDAATRLRSDRLAAEIRQLSSLAARHARIGEVAELRDHIAEVVAVAGIR
jgi:hypothetical protein